MIYIELNINNFAYELSNNKDNWFTYKGAEILFKYLEEFEESIRFDAVALRCEYSEYNLDEFIKEYDNYFNEFKNDNLELDSKELKKEFFNSLVDGTFLEWFIGGDENCFIYRA
jgi:hypothetical protein